MPQQINLCLPILLTPKRYFSALTMVQALAVLLIAGGSLLSYWVWNLKAASEGFKKTLESQARELENLKAAIAQSKAGSGASESVLTQELLGQRTELSQREKLLLEAQRGLFLPGKGHSAHLQLLAQSIPSQVWITEVRAGEGQLEVSGFTLDTAVLSDWVKKLAASPLLQGQKLSSIKVESASVAMANANPNVGAVVGLPLPGPSYIALARPPRPVWSFSWLSSLSQAPVQLGSQP